ncbi:MAG: hypothetical protein QW186_09955 [Candidatus Bathyarchaeia archaeon]
MDREETRKSDDRCYISIGHKPRRYLLKEVAGYIECAKPGVGSTCEALSSIENPKIDTILFSRGALFLALGLTFEGYGA